MPFLITPLPRAFCRLVSLFLAHCLPQTEGNTFIITLALQIYSDSRAKSQLLGAKCTYSTDIFGPEACKM